MIKYREKNFLFSAISSKRKGQFSDSDSDNSPVKRSRGDTASDDEDWTADSEEERITGRSDVIQRAFNRANAQSNGSNRPLVSSSDLSTSLNESMKSNQPVLVANAKGVVKVDPKQVPNLSSGVYVMSRKDGIIKLDSSPGGNKVGTKLGSPMTQSVMMVQSRDAAGNIVRKQVITTTQANSVTPLKVMSKDGNQVFTQMKVATKVTPAKQGTVLSPKTEPIKIQPKPDPSQMQQIHVVTAVPSPIALQPRITTGKDSLFWTSYSFSYLPFLKNSRFSYLFSRNFTLFLVFR